MVRSPNKARKPKATKAGNSAKVAKPTGGSRSLETVKDFIFRSACENHAMGIKDTTKMDLALKAGYGNPRSDTFAKAIQALVSGGLFMKGAAKESFALTEKGEGKIPSDIMKSAPKSNSEMHEHYVAFLEKKVKLGAQNVRPLWDLLKDRKPHTINDLSKKLGYGNPRSFANTKIIPLMKEMGLAEDSGKGSIVLTDVAFPIK
jgi:hypothetical protein